MIMFVCVFFMQILIDIFVFMDFFLYFIFMTILIRRKLGVIRILRVTGRVCYEIVTIIPILFTPHYIVRVNDFRLSSHSHCSQNS